MTTGIFFVAPSEAILLGLCLGEYLEMRKTLGSLSFTQVQGARIDPFVPELTNYHRTSIHYSDLPTDLEDVAPPFSNVSVGRRSAEPNVTYGIDADGAYRRTFSFRKNFSWLLRVYLSSHIGYPDWYRPVLQKMAHDDFDFLAITAEIGAHETQLGTDSGSYYGQFDDPENIEKSILRLIQFNNVERFFELGRCFGILNAGVQQYLDASDERSFFEAFLTVTRAYSKIIETPEIKQSSVAYSAIQALWNIFHHEFNACMTLIVRDGDSLGIPKFNELRDEQKRQVLDACRQRTAGQEDAASTLKINQHMLWIAFGEILGVIRDLDQDAKEQDAASVMPRAFGVGKSDTPERIRKWLVEYERELAHGASEFGKPEKVVIGLKDSIEALAKRLWKKDFEDAKEQRSVLPYLLNSKARSDQSSPQERLFAQVASPLFFGYRNVSTHELDRFRCSISEARFFISGIRLLLELFDEITSLAAK